VFQFGALPEFSGVGGVQQACNTLFEFVLGRFVCLDKTTKSHDAAIRITRSRLDSTKNLSWGWA
jgi:hypothetical protein